MDGRALVSRAKGLRAAHAGRLIDMTHSTAAPRAARSSSVAMALALVAAVAFGCSKPAPSPRGVIAVGPGDSLAHLIRAWLGSKTPDEARERAHRFGCERDRLMLVYGDDSGAAIMQRVSDTIFSIRDLPARRRLDGLMAGWSDMNCSEVEKLRDSLRKVRSAPPTAKNP